MLAVQGDVREHLAALRRCDVVGVPVNQPADFDGIDALALPGGESTTMSRLLSVFGLEQPLRRRLAEGMPCLATCAGLILLATHIADGRPDQLALGTFDITVRRNGWGRQVESFERDLSLEGLDRPLRGVFIRAPRIERTGPNTRILARIGAEPVAIAQGLHIGLTFHPELSGDDRIHQLFVGNLSGALTATA